MANADIQADSAEPDRARDPRARRTRTQLQAALVELATHKDLDEISIGELTAAAEVNRATFYLHYSDKETLLLDAIGAVTAEISLGAAAASRDEFDDAVHAPAHTLAFFLELDRHAALYRRVLGPTGSPAIVDHLRGGMERVIAREMIRRSSGGPLDDRSTERLAAFLAGGIIAAATAWLDSDERIPAAEEAAAVWQMVYASTAALRA